MARSFSNAKLVSAFVSQQISVALSRRGYAAAASEGGAVAGISRRGAGAMSNVMMKKGGGEEFSSAANTSSWVPDPVTGYYKPENQIKEIDAAELRSVLLSHKN